jgi:hypothetical protein
MDEATIQQTIQSLQQTVHSLSLCVNWLIGGVVFCGACFVANLVINAWQASKISGVMGQLNTFMDGMKKFFGWFENRECAVHRVELTDIKRRLGDLER